MIDEGIILNLLCIYNYRTGVDLHNIDKKSLQKRLGLVADDDDDDDNGNGDIVANDASVNVISDNESEFDF
jgi:hypothetical protein